MRLLLPALAVLALLPTTAARAATVTATTATEYEEHDGRTVHVTVHVTAAPGERNDLVVSRPATGSAGDPIVISDAGAAPAAGSGCTAGAAGAVICAAPTGAVTTVDITLGDRDDRLTAGRVAALKADGGEGDDTLAVTGSTGSTLLGGPGADVLTGGDGIDVLDGGPGADRMQGGAGGQDAVLYTARTAPVTATIGAPAGNGEAGEDDAIAADVEDLAGGAGDDVLTGSEAANTISGGGGDDRIAGLGGDDTLYGEGVEPGAPAPTADVIDGGDGADHLTVGPGGRATGGRGGDTLLVTGAGRAVGGPGRDELATLGSGGARLEAAGDGERDILRCRPGAPPRAETLDRHDLPIGCGRAPRRPGAGRVALLRVEQVFAGDLALRAACPDDARRGRCRVRFAVREDGRRAGHTVTRALRAGTLGTVWLSFRTVSRRAAPPPAGTTVTVTAASSDTRGRRRFATITACAADAEGFTDPGPCRP
jgi:Ca2+-binding RTX toxin-like protein